MNKAFALVTFVVFVILGTLFGLAFEASASPAPSSVSIVAPDPMPVDTSRAAIPAVETTPIQTSAEITIYASAPRKVKPAARVVKVAAPKPEKVWTCAAPRPLENDAVQTVRQCQWL